MSVYSVASDCKLFMDSSEYVKEEQNVVVTHSENTVKFMLEMMVSLNFDVKTTSCVQDSNTVVEISLKLAQIFLANGDGVKAEKSLEFSTDAVRKKVVAAGSNVEEDTLALYGMALDKQAQVLMAGVKPKETENIFREAVTVAIKVYGEKQEHVLVVTNSLASVLNMKGEDKAAAQLHEGVVKAARGLDTPHLTSFMVNHGLIRLKQGMLEMALENCEKARKNAEEIGDNEVVVLALIASVEAQDSNIVVEISLKLAQIFLANGDGVKAEKSLEFSTDAMRKKFVPAGNNVEEDMMALYGMALDKQAQVLMVGDKLKEAEKLFREAVTLAIKVYGEKQEHVLVGTNSLASVLNMKGEEEAIAQLLEGVVKAARGLDTPHLTSSMVNHGLIRLKQGMLEMALENCEEARKNAEEMGVKEVVAEANECLQSVMLGVLTLHKVYSYVKESKVRVLVDADKSFYQPSINKLTMRMMNDHETFPLGSEVYMVYKYVSYGPVMDVLGMSNMIDLGGYARVLFQLDAFKCDDILKILKTGDDKGLLLEMQEEQLTNMVRRLHKVFSYAKERNVRVVVDVQQSFYLPAINQLTMRMMIYIKDKVVVFNTYQCYLKNALKTITRDLDQARSDQFYFGAKLVRGAYMDQEREMAKIMDYEDPVNMDYDSTTNTFNDAISVCLDRIKDIMDSEENVKEMQIIVATHNEDTVKHTMDSLTFIFSGLVLILFLLYLTPFRMIYFIQELIFWHDLIMSV